MPDLHASTRHGVAVAPANASAEAPQRDTEPDELDELVALVGEWMTVPDAAQQLSIDVSRVRQLVAERQLLAFRHQGALRIPAAFVADGRVLKGLPGTLTVLADAGFTPMESLRWLFTPDPSLPGAPVQALQENRGTEVKRRAQALAF
jgi:hypothetical protein